MKAIARLFADMGDSYVELIATGMYVCVWRDRETLKLCQLLYH